MTHQEKFNFIREKCIAANPEIVKSKFGLEIGVYQQENYKVLGRPIRLADILLAIGESDWYVGQHGRFFAWSRALGEMIGQTYNWNLREDNLEKQSEETISFLHSLLQ